MLRWLQLTIRVLNIRTSRHASTFVNLVDTAFTQSAHIQTCLNKTAKLEIGFSDFVSQTDSQNELGRTTTPTRDQRRRIRSTEITKFRHNTERGAYQAASAVRNASPSTALQSCPVPANDLSTDTSVYLSHGDGKQRPPCYHSFQCAYNSSAPSNNSLLDTHSFEKTSLTLGDILSPIPRPSYAGTIAVHTLESLYLIAKQRGQLHCLDSHQLTELLSLFGTLSLPKSSSIYNSKLIPYIIDGPSGRVDNWSYVLEIARQKKAVGYELSARDRYWIMRAHLASVNSSKASFSRPDFATASALSMATAQYLKIRHDTLDPEVHIPFFESHLSRTGTNQIVRIVNFLCDALERYDDLDRRFSDMLWSIIMNNTHHLPLILKHRICNTIKTRLSKFNIVTMAVKGEIREEKQHPLNVVQICSALDGAIFPCHLPDYFPPLISRWAFQQVKKAFMTNSLGTQWIVLVHLGIYNMPNVPIQGVSQQHIDNKFDSGSINLLTSLALATLERSLGETYSVESKDGVIAFLRTLWRAWRHADDPSRPTEIKCAIVESFFRLIARTADEPLREGCFRYCVEHELWAFSGNDPFSSRSLKNLIIAYSLASIACQGKSWVNIFTVLDQFIARSRWQDDVIEKLIWHFIPRNKLIAHEIYQFSLRNSVSVSSGVLHVLGVSLASDQQWNLFVPFLSFPRFSRRQKENLLGAALHVFQNQRTEVADKVLVATLAKTLLLLYHDSPPADRLKFPIRFFLTIMIRSHQAQKAVEIIEAIYRRTPSFFTMRLFLRILRGLVSRRQFRLAVRLFRMVYGNAPGGSLALNDIRRKLTLSLTKAGAHNLARQVYCHGVHHRTYLTTLERLSRSVRFRYDNPPRSKAIRIIPMVASRRIDNSSVRYAVSLLINAKRPVAARKLFDRTVQDLDTKTRTAIGNTILHGPLRHLKQRHGRLVRHILRTKDYLTRKFNFVPDRMTVNIILKALLKWQTVMTAPKIKNLFDYMVTVGYPVSDRWRLRHGVPFGTPPSTVSSLKAFMIPSLSPHISFEKHVRPLYKMFIQAFYLRHDNYAAKTIIGILKAEEFAANQEREKRNRARRLGIIKQKRKIVKGL